MRKVGLFIIGVIAAITILCSLGAMAGLAISAAILYAGIHFYLKSDSTFAKIIWALVAIAGLLTAISNVPSFIGLIAIVGLWYIVRKWDGNDTTTTIITAKSDDPFTNFENQWTELSK
ncbi:ABC transporter permease [Viridibacillus sp. YIM B01967]|uniref:ABC transporter permease n=1 Tax=Viridibacillus soli TaxID=2798301 RepID=A0ABS1H7Y8_9BACL|nr:ABC transporter permease [Viridibacillus soli]MBK3495523.1 ABC transporter permease [Viridibacillus soli]